MKLTVFFLTAAFLNVSAKSVSQNITFSGKNVRLEKIFSVVEQQTSYLVFFSRSSLENARPVNIRAENMPLEEFLKTIFKDQPLQYQIESKTISVSPIPAVDLSRPLSFFSPPITGIITDEDGNALSGINVTVKGTSIGVITSTNGSFSLNADIGSILIISSIEYETVEIKILPNKKNIIVLHRKITSLDTTSVIVNTGYQQIPKERATGSFVQIGNQLLNRRVSSDVLSRLEGIVPGLLVNRNVSTANNPNGIDLSIQGYNTIYANPQPLIVVDNFPYDGNIQNINPNDVESITVLKDAAAASIWGTRSGNGVIVITTKRGHRNQNLQITGKFNVTVADKPNLSYNPNFINSSDFIAVEKMLFSQGYFDSKLTAPNYPAVTPVVQILADQRAGLISNADATAQIDALQNVDVRNDLRKYFYQRAITQQYAVNMQGGNNSSDYIFSVGYDKDRDNTVGNTHDRLTLSSNMNFYPIKNMTVSAGFNYVQSLNHANSPVGSLSDIYPYAQLVDDNGKALPIAKHFSQAWVTDTVAQKGLLDWQYRPYDEIHSSNNLSKQADNRLNFGLRYNIINGFSADIKYQYERLFTDNSQYYSADSYYARDLINQFTNLSAPNPNSIPIGAIYNDGAGYLTSNHIRGQLNYSSQWNNKHNLTILAGSEISDMTTESQGNATVYGYNKDNGTFQNVDFVNGFTTYPSFGFSLIPNSQGFSKRIDRNISYFSNGSYSFEGKYIVSASARIDYSNLFGVKTNQKANPLYSIGFSWDISKESFYDVSWLPYLKIRATYGYNGNIYKDATGVLTGHQNSNSYYFGIPYEQIFNPGNPELKWENVRKINFGTDFAFKNDLISGSFDYYFKKGIDLFGNTFLAPSTGFTDFSVLGNNANTKGSGFDLAINIRPVRIAIFEWEANLLISHALDKVTKYDVESTTSSDLLANASIISPVVGKPIFSIYSYKSGPLTNNTGDPQGYLNGELSTDYANIIRNASSVDSLIYGGPSRPTIYGSFRNTIRYRSISLSANIVYKLNYYFRRTSIDYYALFSGGIQNEDFYKRWQQPGDEAKTSVPSMPASVANLDQNRESFYSNSKATVEKGDHIRLQDIMVDYDLNVSKLIGKNFRHIHLFLYINNVGIIWRANHDRLDPDTYNGSLPLPRTYSFGLRTNLN